MNGKSRIAIPRRSTANVAVREAIRSAILDGTLSPGAKLIQTELADLLGTSITPIREALRELATEGLVDFDSYRGAWVHEPSVDEILEVYTIRKVLVPLALTEAAAVRTEAELQEALTLVERMDDAEDVAEWALLNRDFHRLMTLNPQRPRLTAIIDNLRDTVYFVALTLVRETRSATKANADHRRMVSAMREQDLETLSALAVTHLCDSLESLTAALENHHLRLGARQPE